MPALRHLAHQRFRRLSDIAIALSAEKDDDRLLERIVESAMDLTGADGGTLYLRSEDGQALTFAILMNRSLDLHCGGTSGRIVELPPVPLYDTDGSANRRNVAACAVHDGVTVPIADAYSETKYDLSGTRRFDEQTGYRSVSFLTVPMPNHLGDVIGVLQLLNATSDVDGGIVPFDEEDTLLVGGLASQAAIALTKKRLIDDQQRLFDSLIKLIAGAIDEKSPYTGGHSRRVPELTLMLADAAARCPEGPLGEFTMSEADRYELEAAAWLHDCGKITTPNSVMDKATKLETVFDRIELVRTRFEVLKRDAEIALLRERLASLAPEDPIDRITRRRVGGMRAELEEEQAFLERCNIGGETMAAGEQERVREIARRRWRDGRGVERELLNAEEVENLTVSRGTLTDHERSVINRHISTTIDMLESLPYPKHLKRVPEFAGGHHERMDGKGYPRGLTRDEMSPQARIIGIADVFEALTARDRPYKSPKTVSEALAILQTMAEEGHIDPDLHEVFIRDKVYVEYALRFLEEDQIDVV